jgi:hypothetical protein
MLLHYSVYLKSSCESRPSGQFLDLFPRQLFPDYVWTIYPSFLSRVVPPSPPRFPLPSLTRLPFLTLGTLTKLGDLRSSIASAGYLPTPLPLSLCIKGRRHFTSQLTKLITPI